MSSTLIYDKNKLKENVNYYKNIGNIYYPVKANSNHLVLKTLNEIFNMEDKFFISYIHHFEKLKELNIDSSYISLMNPLLSFNDYQYLYNQGVRSFTFDNFNIFKAALQYFDLDKTEWIFRLNLNEIYPSFISNIGCSFDEILEMINMLNNTNIGISFYINEYIKKLDKKALKEILFFIKGKVTGIKFISIGGISDISKNDIDLIKQIKIDMNLEKIIVEPGKGLVYNAFSLKTDIIKRSIYKNYDILTLETGIYNGLLDIVLKNKRFNLSIYNDKLIPLSKNNWGIKRLLYIFGGSSDSSDFLGMYYIDEKNYKNIGNTIIISNCGSYFEEFIMDYGKDIEFKEEIL